MGGQVTLSPSSRDAPPHPLSPHIHTLSPQTCSPHNARRRLAHVLRKPLELLTNTPTASRDLAVGGGGHPLSCCTKTRDRVLGGIEEGEVDEACGRGAAGMAACGGGCIEACGERCAPQAQAQARTPPPPSVVLSEGEEWEGLDWDIQTLTPVPLEFGGMGESGIKKGHGREHSPVSWV
jgi:hypothetical protein